MKQINPALGSSLYFQFGHCPAQCHDQSKLQGPTGVTYRSSGRSLTLRCSQCGLLWTMTVHQLAKAAKRLAALHPNEPVMRRFAHIWAEWAEAIDDKRGKKKKKSA